jgi:hypothetical protein
MSKSSIIVLMSHRHKHLVLLLILHMHLLLLGGGGVFFGVRLFLGALLWQRPNKGLVRSFLGYVARQRPVSNNREVISLGSVPRIR